MNFQSMNYFIMVARQKSFTKAAENLHITQQTLSVHIASLEKELKCKLFIRHVPLVLTYGGEVFLQYAVELQKKYQALQHEFADIAHNENGQLRIGVGYTRGRAIMPDLIEAFQKQYPNIEIQIKENANDALQKSLLAGEIDLAIANFPAKIPGVTLYDFYEEEIILLLADKLVKTIYGSAAKQILDQVQERRSLAGLKACPFMLNSEQDIAGRIGRTILAKAHFRPLLKVQSGSVQTLLSLCLKGVAACFCQKNLALATLSQEQLQNLHMIGLDKSASYMIRFGVAEHSYQWKMIRSFMQIAWQQQGS